MNKKIIKKLLWLLLFVMLFSGCKAAGESSSLADESEKTSKIAVETAGVNEAASETLEETVAREVMEETGIRVKNIRYYKSQPWGMAQDILVGFFCEADGEGNIHMDESELKYAEWVSREDIVLQPNNLSLTNEMIKVFKEGKDF